MNNPNYIEAKNLTIDNVFTTQAEWDDWMTFGGQPGTFTVLDVKHGENETSMTVSYHEPGYSVDVVKHYPNNEKLILVRETVCKA